MEQGIQIEVENNQNPKLVPKLRFREFDGEWKTKKFGDITIKVGSGSTPRGGSEIYTNEGIPFIRSQNVNDNRLILDDTCISEEINEKMKGSIVKPNDVLLNITGASIGRSCIVPSKFKIGNVNQHVCIIRVNSLNNPKFVQIFLSSEKGKRLVNQGQTGSGREGLNFQSIRLFKCKFPTLQEQQKIASFFSAVDKKIQKLARKKELLESYKKGVMQKLFSQELRFKYDDGNDFTEWEVRVLKNILIEYRLGGNYSNTEQITAYPLIKMGNLGRGKINLRKIEYIAVGEKTEEKDKLEFGDLLFNTRNTLELVGKVSIWKNELSVAFYNSNLMYLKFENNFFMNFRMNSYEGLKELKKIATGTTSVAAIYTKDLLKVKHKIPCLQEQQKIADFLSGIDIKIESVTQQITKTQSFKKGLLQQMFI